MKIFSFGDKIIAAWKMGRWGYAAISFYFFTWGKIEKTTHLHMLFQKPFDTPFDI